MRSSRGLWTKLESSGHNLLIMAGVIVGLMAMVFSFRAWSSLAASDRKIEAMKQTSHKQWMVAEKRFQDVEKTWAATQRLEAKVNILSARVEKAFGGK